MSTQRSFDHLVFDLDDTLLDTFRQLVPRASREAVVAMIEAGLNADVEAALAAWDEHGRTAPRREIFSHLATKFGLREGFDPSAVEKRGYHTFYNRKVETDITLFEGTRELLTSLRESYVLHLVTSGSKVTQEEKIRILGIRGFFSSITHVDPSRGDKKGAAFKAIGEKSQVLPSRHLSIGNRVDTDVGEARAIGWKGCWVRYGEHMAMMPSSEIEMPDFVVDNILELRDKCRL